MFAISHKSESFYAPNYPPSGAMSGSAPGISNEVASTYFHSLSTNQMNGLATDLSDLAIGDRPPPRKIRRRNALTVQDPHFPSIVPPPNSPEHDPFEDSSRLQALDEIIHRDFSLEDEDSQSSLNNNQDQSLPHLNASMEQPKRKLAYTRRTSGPRLPGEEREVRQIHLHKDLEQYKPDHCLPEILVRKYVKAVKSSLFNPCSALVPYTPPEKIISDILGGGGKDTPTAGSSSPKCDTDALMETDE